jgi:hypothetical protein
MAHAGGIWPQRRRRSRRQRLRHEIQPLEHPRPPEVQIDVIVENDVDHGKAESRLRSHDPHARQALEVDRQWIGDLVLDFLRAVAGPIREDDHLVVGQVRDGVDRRTGERPPAPAGQSGVGHDDQQPMPQREFNESPDHARDSPCAQKRTASGAHHASRHTGTVLALDQEDGEEGLRIARAVREVREGVAP